MKKLFEIPKAEILKLCAEDVVCTSGLGGIEDEMNAGNGAGIEPKDPFNAGNDD